MAAVIFKGLICLEGFASLVIKMINPPLMSTMFTTIHGKINPVEFLRNPFRSRMEAIRVVMEAINTETRSRLDKGFALCVKDCTYIQLHFLRLLKYDVLLMFHSWFQSQ